MKVEEWVISSASLGAARFRFLEGVVILDGTFGDN
jgi:hypothetical protein